jgi:NADPH-dependent 2,4-dienoyl-CoA reductase/sulfur reductase-like enzyme
VRTPATTLPDADLVLIAAGVKPRGEIAAAAGLATHHGRIVVDEHMRASADGVLAAGDVAWAGNAAAGRHLAVEHWGDALAMGEIAGRTAAGEDAQWDAAPGFWSTIGTRTLKYAAWGDGHDEARFVQRPAGGWSVWYGRDRVTVGVLAHDADADYERGRELVEHGAPLP